MIFYICCKQDGNNCHKREECRRFLNADMGESWTLFKHVCTEENNYQLFMERVDSEIIVPKEKDDEEINEQDS